VFRAVFDQAFLFESVLQEESKLTTGSSSTTPSGAATRPMHRSSLLGWTGSADASDGAAHLGRQPGIRREEC
jgi:hypothetical protein